MSKHTSGPWQTTGTQHEEVRNSDGLLVCKARSDDAPLIAAAPDLLAVLQDVMDRPLLTEGTDWWMRVRAAIAKATGQDGGAA